MRVSNMLFAMIVLAGCNGAYGWTEYSNVDHGDAALCAPVHYIAGGQCNACPSAKTSWTFNATACCTPGFAAQSTYALATSAQPYGVAAGDINGDGFADVVTANSTPGNVSVLVSKGDGSFSPQVTYAAGSGPSAVIEADFSGHGDHALDLAVANSGDHTISVLLNGGTGGFGAQTTYATGQDPWALAVGDFNRDGAVDIVVVNNKDDTFSLLLNDGTGGFGAQTMFATGDDPASIAVGDVDGDGFVDVVVASLNGSQNGGGAVSVFINDNSHPGHFLPAVDYTFANAQSVAVGDFDGDGYLDLVAASAAQNQVGVFFNLGSLGAGKFNNALVTPTGSSPWSVGVGDFNADGLLDIAAANQDSHTVSVLLNAGDGRFGATTESPTVGSDPLSLAVGDFNGDGHADIVTANLSDNDVSVLFTQCSF